MTKSTFFPVPALWPLWLAHGLSLLLHIQRIEWWFLLLWVFIVFWHYRVVLGQWFLPGRWVKSLIVILCCGLLVLSYRNWLNLEPLVSLLLLAFILKLVELKTHRDGFVILCLSYFITATHFLFGQDLVATLSGLLSIFVTTIVLIHWQAYRYRQRRAFKGSSSTKKSAIMLVQAIPIMILLMIFLPRLGTLWSISLRGDQGFVGMSDSMSPGDISQLSQRDALAFRVSFEGPQVPASERYWRGLVLTNFDGRTWSRDKQLPAGKLPQSIPADGDYRYTIMLEPTGKDWLYGVVSVKAISQSVTINDNHEILGKRVDQRIQYDVVSTIEPRKTISALEKNKNLALPAEFDSKSRDWARDLRRQSSSEEDYINRVLQFYRDRFVYTLSPPLLGKNTIDEFLFETQRGFCEHFSSSFVVLMRSAGIPARVVVGYQGGQWIEEEQYLRVSQTDAHAWAEVWLDGKGWQRVDPTAAVAPSRIERNLFEALGAEDKEQLTHYRSAEWLQDLKLKWDAINYRWQQWILGFDSQAQQAMLRDWFGKLSLLKLAFLMVLFVGLIFLMIALWQYYRSRRHVSQDVLLYQRYLKRLQKFFDVNETSSLAQINDMAECTDGVPRERIQQLNRYFERLFYAPNPNSVALRKAIREGLKALK